MLGLFPKQFVGHESQKGQDQEKDNQTPILHSQNSDREAQQAESNQVNPRCQG
jgi:hypothetical protein